MELTIGNTILFLATVLTGISAGLCFTWTNAVTTGIGQLDNLGYLQAFQQMNRAILNPLFFVVFFSPFFTSFAAAFLNKGHSPRLFWMTLAAAAIYSLGVVVVTILGNVPLNEILNGTNLAQSSNEELRALRTTFEKPWNKLHFIRTISSAVSLGLLIIAGIGK